MTHDKAIQLDSQYIMGTYGRYPLVPASASGSVITDENGKKYIDFTSGIGVNSLGWCDEGWLRAVTGQLGKFQHISNYFVSVPTAELAKELVTRSGLCKAFFGNSGAEANEGAIKTARKYSSDRYPDRPNRRTIVSLDRSFHGRTITTLAATGQDVFHRHFDPFTAGFKYSPLNDICALKSALTADVCAVIAEPVQGEGGVNIMTAEFASALRQLCDERDLLLIFDEIQTGIGRTGTLFSFEQYVKPDILTLAKGLGGGLPVGAFVCGEKCASVLGSGMHGTTFGGNPVVAAGACEVLSRITSDGFLASVREKGAYIRSALASKNLPVKDIRGLGMMIGIEVADGLSHKEIARTAFDRGLLVLTAGSNVVRLLPPLNITYGDIDAGIGILAGCFEKA